MSRRSRRHESVNVRGDLVGPQEAEQLGVADDRRTALATMVLGALMVVIGAVVLVQAGRLDNGDDLVGAATAPWVVGALMFLVGVLLAIRGRRDMGVWEVSAHTTAQDWKRMGVLLGVLLGFAVVVPWLGYVVSATLLFGCTAVVLGAPHRLRSFATGFCVAALVFLAFDAAIGISLPAGPWGF
ncbi:tripartite tricarboxylate transporter TctB family protein [Nocardioides pantholopis]|uniref:tripartite tricarboxylate transporter TctB family protein n=1 Tax=Nocardioides pantholopis TaxID=2483798 RepID=UPI000F082FA5|nr:tripartite tricarboxylate transporter TctB family protein [Nocardioides pantholopis]